MSLRGAQIQRLVLELTGDWHPDLRRIFALGDPGSSFPLEIRTSEPVAPWTTTHITLLGDAIHTMTPDAASARTPPCATHECSPRT